MDKNKAKSKLKSFLDGRELTFSVTQQANGEWVAVCNEIPAIMTCGASNDISQRDELIRDAICTAAGVDPQYSKDILKFVGYKMDPPFSRSEKRSVKSKSEYVLS